MTNKSRWLRRLVLGVSLLPVAVLSTLHTMGRTEDFGVLGEWYVMLPLTLACVAGWLVVEKAAGWATRDES
jgi:hypothetical protein